MNHADMTASPRQLQSKWVLPDSPAESSGAILTKLSEQNRMLDRMLENFDRLIGNVTVPQMPSRGDLISGTVQPIIIKEYSLTNARTDEEIGSTEGNIVLAVTDGEITGIGVRLNERQAPINYFHEHNPIEAPFYRIFLTNTAQSGKTLKLIIGTTGLVNLHQSPLPVHPKPRFHRLYLPYGYFTESLATNSIEAENIPGLVCNRIRLTGIVLQSDQNLHYRLYLYNSNLFQSDSRLAAAIDMDLPAIGYRVAATGKYLLDLQGLDIDYEDEDGTWQLHAVLENLSATSKNAETLNAMAGAKFWTGGSWANQTAEANNSTPDDVELLSGFEYAFGGSAPFDTLVMNLSTPGVGAWKLSWKYWNGSAWKNLPNVVDETDEFRIGGPAQKISFSIPNDWVTTSLDGTTAYWIKAVITFGSITTYPLATQLWTVTRSFKLTFTYEERR